MYFNWMLFLTLISTHLYNWNTTELKNIFTFYYNFTECFSRSRSSLNQILLNITDSLITDTIINNKLSEDWRLEWAALTRRHWESHHWTQSVATRSYISRADNTISVTLSNVALLREQNFKIFHRIIVHWPPTLNIFVQFPVSSVANPKHCCHHSTVHAIVFSPLVSQQQSRKIYSQLSCSPLGSMIIWKLLTLLITSVMFIVRVVWQLTTLNYSLTERVVRGWTSTQQQQWAVLCNFHAKFHHTMIPRCCSHWVTSHSDHILSSSSTSSWDQFTR